MNLSAAATRDQIIQATIRNAVTKLDGQGFLLVTLNDQDLWLPPATIRTMTHCFHMEESGRFVIHVERPHFDWMRAQLRPGSHFIDVGAATGAMSLPFAKEFGQSVPIISFEPATAARALLTNTARRNALRSIRILPMACSDHAGHATFHEFLQDDTDVTPFLPETSTLADTSDPRAHAISVELTTLDAQFASSEVENAVVKIDVEGFEAKVLAGGLQFLTRVRPALAIDIHVNPFGEGTTEADVQAILVPLGYHFEKLGHVLTCSVD
jgi:FkbM family methyltransferase